MNAIDHATVMNGSSVSEAMTQGLPGMDMKEERLPFSVKVVRSDNALRKAVGIRQAAYARHVPAFAAKLGSPEPNDHDHGSVVLLAESRLDGSPVGTMRIQTNRYEDLPITQSVELPGWLKDKSMAEAGRLAVAPGRAGRVVKTTIFKSFYLYCREAHIEWIVIGARPPLDRQYEALMFEDLFPGQSIPMRHGNNIPHRVLAFDVLNAKARRIKAAHPLLDFMCHTYHPDIDLSDADFPAWGDPLRPSESPRRLAAGA